MQQPNPGPSESIINSLNEGKQSTNEWNINCPSGNRIFQMCVELSCNKSALHCNRPECDSCSGLHPFCKVLSIDVITNFLTENHRNQLRLRDITLSIEQEMIRNLQESQQKLNHYLHYIGLPPSIQSVLVSIFRNHQFDRFTGMDLESLTNQIGKFKPMNKQKIMLDHSLKFQSTLNAYLNEKLQIMTSMEGNQRIISKILFKEEDVDFLFQSLGKPRKLQLLYRGTQNYFSAAKFHQKCDSIEHTVTVLRTEFDRVIAAYTPLKWSSPSTWTAFNDNANRSFLLQVNLKEKFALTEPLYAIYCHQMHGPRFGRADLAIPNKCNQNNCTGNFPTSYNLLGRYTNGQQSCTAFSGSPSGFSFRTLEYEVFKVIF